MENAVPVATIEWVGGVDGYVRLLDQTLLPAEARAVECRDPEAVWEAIRSLRVRGAPAIGIAAAMGIVLGIQNFRGATATALAAEVDRCAEYLATSRPTAMNLFWGIERMRRIAAESAGMAPADAKRRLLAEALAILEEDKTICRSIGLNGAGLIRDGAGVLTHCNAGRLATGGSGTALAAVYAAREAGRRVHVFADETRPLLQGARLTAWELMQAGIDVTLICDNTAAVVMGQDKVDIVLVGADRIAANGDTANKVGTCGLSVLAAAHGIPFYVAAPLSTFDLSIPSGDGIPIEERDAEEVTCWFGRRTAPEGVRVYSPAFDVTPAARITGIITERGIINRPDASAIAEHFREAKR